MAFGTITQEAGDFKNGKNHQYVSGVYHMKKQGKFFTVKYRSNQVKALEAASEENISGLGWGAAGLVAFGGLGLVAGLLKGSKNNVTFILTFNDGLSFMGTTTKKTYSEMSAQFYNIQRNSKPTTTIPNNPALGESQAYAKIIKNITEVDLTKSHFNIQNPTIEQIKEALKKLSEEHSYQYIDNNPQFLIDKLLELNPELSA